MCGVQGKGLEPSGPGGKLEPNWLGQHRRTQEGDAWWPQVSQSEKLLFGFLWPDNAKVTEVLSWVHLAIAVRLL